jgi:ElaB/YqjD/DUF883 family membrane-anchored ribosome-binding protein
MNLQLAERDQRPERMEWQKIILTGSAQEPCLTASHNIDPILNASLEEEKMKTPVNEAAARANELAGIPAKVVDELRHIVESAYDDVSRNVRKARHTAEDAIDQGRHEIKRHPFAAVGTAALAGVLVGFAIGWLAINASRD